MSWLALFLIPKIYDLNYRKELQKV